MSHYSRKEFLKIFLQGAGCYAAAASLPFEPLTKAVKAKGGGQSVIFPQGVASGDPTPDSVVLWTRALQKDVPSSETVAMRLQVAETSTFHTVVTEKKCKATSDADHTVRVIVHDLEPNTWYYYRFITNDGTTSLHGRTHTAPTEDSTRNVKFAIASCQAYEGGYYNAYRALLDRDKKASEGEKIEFVLHLGDFIYETLGYGSARKLPEFPSGGKKLDDEDVDWARSYAVTLDDYRHLYKMYLQDPDLKEARARWPFIATWDDHEFTDDNWQGVSTYEVPDTPAQKRKLAANKAWFEYMPAFLTGLADATKTEQHARDFKPADVDNKPISSFDKYGFGTEHNNRKAVDSLVIYRSLRWGEHIKLLIADTRSYRSMHPVPGEIALKISGNARYIAPLPLVKLSDAGKTFNNGNPPDSIKIGDNTVPNKRKQSPPGTILGNRQKQWLKDQLQNSDATWNLFASSVPMMPMRLDMHQVNPDAKEVVFTTDTWEGYMKERQEILDFVDELNTQNLISLSGDNHNSFAGILKKDFEQQDSKVLGAEFSVCGISSTSVFDALYNIVEEDSDMRPIVTYDATKHGGTNKKVENLNTAFLWGTKSAVTAAKTNDLTKAKKAENKNQNPHLRYVDSAANGIAVITVTGKSVSGEFITIQKPVSESKGQVTVLRQAHLDFNKDGSNTDLNLKQIDGQPPYPLTDWS